MGFLTHYTSKATSTLSPYSIRAFTQSFSTPAPTQLSSYMGTVSLFKSHAASLRFPGTEAERSMLVITTALLVLALAIKWIHPRVVRYGMQYSKGARTASCPFSMKPSPGSLSSISLQSQKAYELPSLKAPSSSNMTMGLRRLDRANWLTITPGYMREHLLRSELLATQKSNVVQCLPGSEAACREVLSLVSTFLIARYPDIFTISQRSTFASSPTIHNALTGESFPLGAENLCPLETAARLAMEDFNILVRPTPGDEYRLLASATLFPAGWKLQERIGDPLSELHGPAPNWASTLACPVTRYFDHLGPHTAMERHPLFVQTDERLFCPEPLPVGATPAAEARPPTTTTAPTSARSLRPEDIQLRRERQTFLPLEAIPTQMPVQPVSLGTRNEESKQQGPKMVLFTVHTYLTPLIDLCDDELDALVRMAHSWPDDVAAYKGRDAWLDVVLRYQEGRERGEK